MCYSGRCLWEDHMGDCTYPTYILGDKPIRCNCTMQEFQNCQKEVKRYRDYHDRKYKISQIKKIMSEKMDF